MPITRKRLKCLEPVPSGVWIRNLTADAPENGFLDDKSFGWEGSKLCQQFNTLRSTFLGSRSDSHMDAGLLIEPVVVSLPFVIDQLQSILSQHAGDHLMDFRE